jgi:hypothetical protein
VCEGGVLFKILYHNSFNPTQATEGSDVDIGI